MLDRLASVSFDPVGRVITLTYEHFDAPISAGAIAAAALGVEHPEFSGGPTQTTIQTCRVDMLEYIALGGPHEGVLGNSDRDGRRDWTLFFKLRDMKAQKMQLEPLNYTPEGMASYAKDLHKGYVNAWRACMVERVR